MEITKALERIQWRLSTIKNLNNTDKEAFNTILSFVEKKETYNVNSNPLLTNLYVWVYTRLLMRLETTVEDKLVQKMIHDILRTPTDVLIEDLKNTINDCEVNSRLKSKGATNEHHRHNDVKELGVKIEDFNNDWSFEEVKQNVIKIINQLIIDHEK